MGFSLFFNLSSGANVFPNNAFVSFKVRAKNGVGYGPFSSILEVQCSTTPTFMNIPVNYTLILYDKNFLNWTPITDLISTGRSSIVHYSLEFYYKTCYNTEDDGLPCGDGWPTDTTEWGELKNPGSWIVLYQESAGLFTSYTHIWT